jgi:guanylate kinase
MVDNNEMLEYAEVFGNFYGSPREVVENTILEGKDVIFDIDWQGGQQIRNSGLASDVVSIFILPPSLKELQERLRGRGQDTDEVIQNRMEKCREEINHWAEYDYCLVNRKLDDTEEDLKNILKAERLKKCRQLTLEGLVSNLYNEVDLKS